jgi:hypothetical protein
MDDLLAAGLYGASSGSIEGIATTGGGGNPGQAAARYQVQLKAPSGSVEEGACPESVCLYGRMVANSQFVCAVVCAGAVGYPLDEAAAGSSLLNLAGNIAGAQTSPRVKAEAPAVSLLAQGPGQGQQMRVRAPIVDVAGLSAVAHLYQPGSFQNNGGTGNSGGAAPTSGAVRQSSGQYASVGGNSSGEPGSALTQPPLVSSVLLSSRWRCYLCNVCV